jgi:hypothetical protein
MSSAGGHCQLIKISQFIAKKKIKIRNDHPSNGMVIPKKVRNDEVYTKK